jgi:hypothetical protein
MQLEGPHVLRALRPGSRPTIAAVRCRVLPNGSLLIRTIPGLISFSWHSPFPFKTVLSSHHGSAVVTGALPVGSLLFCAAIAAGTTGVQALFVAAFVLTCVAFERQRAIRVARAVLTRLSAEPAAV